MGLNESAPDAAPTDGGAAASPERGRDDAGDADGAGSKGGKRGEDVGDPLTTPSTAAAAHANEVPVKGDSGRGTGGAEEGGLAGGEGSLEMK